MKNSKLIYWPLSLPLIVIFIGLIYFYNGEKKYNKMVDDYQEKEIKGLIINLKEEGRGDHLLEINDKVSNKVLKYSLPVSWEIKEYGIQNGDSVSKEANSKTITFYKNEGGVYIKLCDFEL